MAQAPQSVADLVERYDRNRDIGFAVAVVTLDQISAPCVACAMGYHKLESGEVKSRFSKVFSTGDDFGTY